ncbi:hypothetical protein, partial [Waltera sp.]|uniref:hypothetical protein n=1 Tax=Waltera sp. TaxID=2815806 RepID=UPI003AF19929
MGAGAGGIHFVTFWRKCCFRLSSLYFLFIILLRISKKEQRSSGMKTKELLADSFRELVLTTPFS